MLMGYACTTEHDTALMGNLIGRVIGYRARNRGVEAVEPVDLFLWRQLGTIGNVIDRAGKMIEGHDRRAMLTGNQTGGDRKILRIGGFARWCQNGFFRYCILGYRQFLTGHACFKFRKCSEVSPACHQDRPDGGPSRHHPAPANADMRCRWSSQYR